MTPQKQKLLRARIALALFEENGRKPTAEEVEKWSRAARILYRTVVTSFFERKQQKVRYRQLTML